MADANTSRPIPCVESGFDYPDFLCKPLLLLVSVIVALPTTLQESFFVPTEVRAGFWQGSVNEAEQVLLPGDSSLTPRRRDTFAAAFFVRLAEGDLNFPAMPSRPVDSGPGSFDKRNGFGAPLRC